MQGLNEKTIEEKEKGILYTGQKRLDTDGKFAFTIGYNKEDMPQNATGAAAFDVRVVANQGTEVVNLTVELVLKKFTLRTVERITLQRQIQGKRTRNLQQR